MGISATPWGSEAEGERIRNPSSGGWPAGALALLVLLSAFIVVHTNLVLVTGLSHYYDGRRILQLVLLASMALVLVASMRLRTEMMVISHEFSWVLKGTVIAVGGAGIISSLRAPLPQAGLREVALFSLLGVLTVAVAAARRALGLRFDRTVIVSIVAGGFVYLVIFVALRRAHIALLGFESLSVHPQHLFYGWSNARFFGQIGVWVFPLLVAAPLLLRDRSRITRSGAWLVAAGWWALIIEAGGRGSIIFTVVAVLVVAILLGRLARNWAAAAAVVVAAGTVVWFAASRLMHMLYAPAVEGDAPSRAMTPGVERAIQRGTSDNFRFAFWQDALEMIQSAPLLGVGPEHYAYHQQTLHTAAPHNVPLQLASEWGVPAAVVLGALVGWATLAWTRTWRAQVDTDNYTRSVVPGLTAAAVGAGMLGMVEGVIVTPASQIMLALVAGWMLAIHRAATHPSHRVSRAGPLTTGRRRWGGHVTICVTVLAFTATLIWTAGPYLWSPNETLDQQIEEHNFGSLSPRFWVQGRLFDE